MDYYKFYKMNNAINSEDIKKFNFDTMQIKNVEYIEKRKEVKK